MPTRILLTLPDGLTDKLDQRMEEKKEISRQEFIRKILEKELG